MVNLQNDLKAANEAVTDIINKLKNAYCLDGISFSFTDDTLNPLGVNIDVNSNAFNAYCKNL